MPTRPVVKCRRRRLVVIGRGIRRYTIGPTSSSPAIEHSQKATPSGCAPLVVAIRASEKDKPHIAPITMRTNHAQTFRSAEPGCRDVPPTKDAVARGYY